MSTERSRSLFDRARRTIPGGVNSPVRAWRSVGGDPRFVASAKGSRIVDVDGNEYVDFVSSWGPMILGHAHPNVVEAITRTAARGTSFGASTEAEVELAEAIVAAVPSIEKVRLVSSGTEAAMTAMRIARAATGRDAVVKFAGCYHGHTDSMLVKAGSGVATLGVPDSAGVPDAMAALTRTAEYNDLASVDAVLDEDVAAIVVEPVAGNMGVVPPADGFLEGLRERATRAGALLVFDEVISGFRVGRGGVQEATGVLPDVTVLGKIIGGGLPVGAVGGKAEVMDVLAPVGPAYQAGTLSGNPLAVAAGLATLAELDDAAYAELERKGARVEQGLRAGLAGYGRPTTLNRVGSMLTLFFGVERVGSFADASKLDAEAFGRWFHAMIDRGQWLPPSGYEAIFLSLAHDDADLDGFVEAAVASLP